mmetsp:Transcript_14351/g.25680  ORF Transcript_14351/g.25680 Transcript_14351/m.25680 type:complete len:422 (-) Transcript_14351:713-1978(-)
MGTEWDLALRTSSSSSDVLRMGMEWNLASRTSSSSLRSIMGSQANSSSSHGEPPNQSLRVGTSSSHSNLSSSHKLGAQAHHHLHSSHKEKRHRRNQRNQINRRRNNSSLLSSKSSSSRVLPLDLNGNHLSNLRNSRCDQPSLSSQVSRGLRLEDIGSSSNHQIDSRGLRQVGRGNSNSRLKVSVNRQQTNNSHPSSKNLYNRANSHRSRANNHHVRVSSHRSRVNSKGHQAEDMASLPSGREGTACPRKACQDQADIRANNILLNPTRASRHSSIRGIIPTEAHPHLVAVDWEWAASLRDLVLFPRDRALDNWYNNAQRNSLKRSKKNGAKRWEDSVSLGIAQRNWLRRPRVQLWRARRLPRGRLGKLALAFGAGFEVVSIKSREVFSSVMVPTNKVNRVGTLSLSLEYLHRPVKEGHRSE